MLQNLAIVVDDPLPPCGRPDPVSRRHHRSAPTARAPSSPRIENHEKENGDSGRQPQRCPSGSICRRTPSSRPELELTKKKSATAPPATSPSNPAAGCRCTAQADRAGRAGRADQMASRRPASRVRVRAASMVNSVSGVVVLAWSLLFRRAQRPAVRQELHLSSCADFRDRL